MKTIGLIGGMSWESTQDYYRLLNQGVGAARGGHSSAKILMYSLDFSEVEAHLAAGRWDENRALLVDAAQRLERGGADLFLICTNTMHKLAPEVQAAVSIPLVHIAEVTGQAIAARGMKRVGLLGTRPTMELPFYRERLAEAGIEVLLPSEAEMARVHRVIFEELTHGKLLDASRADYLGIIEGMVVRGAEGVVLGCTEIGSLITEAHTRTPLFDTTRLHAEAAVKLALAEG